jgi:hypothetical protein
MPEIHKYLKPFQVSGEFKKGGARDEKAHENSGCG